MDGTSYYTARQMQQFYYQYIRLQLCGGGGVEQISRYKLPILHGEVDYH